MFISLYIFLHCLRKCCACVTLCTVRCESAAPAAKLVPLAKVLRLPRNLDRTLRKYCTCRESVPDLARVLRLLRNLYLTFLTPLICRRLTVINAPFSESSLLRSSPPFVESSLLRASWAGLPPPPTPPMIFRMCTEITAPFAESSLLRSSPPFVDHHFFEHHGGGCRPPALLLICRMRTELNAPLVESSLPRTSWGAPPNLPADFQNVYKA